MIDTQQKVPHAGKDLLSAVRAFIDQHNLITPKSTLIVGLSGGPDSVCLLSLLNKLVSEYKITLIAAHLDHGWRTSSAQDAAFCKEFAHSLGVKYEEAQASDIQVTKKYNGSQEERGRALRRQFFESLAQTHSASAIALGHHQDDQQETFFLRLIRGASIAGLASMRPQHGVYIRPLLTLHKQEIVEYLHAENLPYVVDATNKDTTFLRNAIRQSVLPTLRTQDERFDKNFKKALAHIQQTELFLERTAHTVYAKITKEQDGMLLLDYEKLLAVDPFLHHRLLLLWLTAARVPFTPSTAYLNEIMRFLHNSGSAHHISNEWTLEKDRIHARLVKRERGPT